MKTLGLLLLTCIASIAVAADDPRDAELRSLRATVKMQQAQIAKLNAKVKGLKAGNTALLAANQRLEADAKIQAIAGAKPPPPDHLPTTARNIKVANAYAGSARLHNVRPTLGQSGRYRTYDILGEVENISGRDIRQVCLRIVVLDASGQPDRDYVHHPVGPWTPHPGWRNPGFSNTGHPFWVISNPPLTPKTRRAWNFVIVDSIENPAIDLRIVLEDVVFGDPPSPEARRTP